MRKIIYHVVKAVIILVIINLITNNYFSYTILNLFILSMLGLPGVIVIYLISLL